LNPAFGEALALGASGGLDLGKTIDTLQASSFHSPLYLMKGEQILKGDWSARFVMEHAEKDQRLAQERRRTRARGCPSTPCAGSSPTGSRAAVAARTCARWPICASSGRK
jgi:3-hydroxyisobutyrate dehydrogenase-like beta-hydroxyacid dehydrogenase